MSAASRSDSVKMKVAGESPPSAVRIDRPAAWQEHEQPDLRGKTRGKEDLDERRQPLDRQYRRAGLRHAPDCTTLVYPFKPLARRAFSKAQAHKTV
jgi:hypothetical protein